MPAGERLLGLRLGMGLEVYGVAGGTGVLPTLWVPSTWVKRSLKNAPASHANAGRQAGR